MRPVSGKFPITQRWGVKDVRYKAGFHTGTDFGCPIGTPVRAPHAGQIIRVLKMDKSYGNAVYLLGTGGKREWVLAHLSYVRVETGQEVKAGQVIGLSGDTGNTRGAHLHAEERHSPFGYFDSQRPTAWRNG